MWVRNQNAGELDDTKLVDGATGERNIFKKRGNNSPMFGNVQTHPKRELLTCVHSIRIVQYAYRASACVFYAYDVRRSYRSAIYHGCVFVNVAFQRI